MRTWAATELSGPCWEPESNMDQEAMGNIVLLAIVTLISVVQNGREAPPSGEIVFLDV